MTSRVILITFVFSFIGCGPTFVDDMDAKLATLVQNQQGRTLGDSEAVDPDPTPVNTTISGGQKDIYNTSPATANPPAIDLPVEADPKGQESTLGKTRQSLSIDENAVEVEMSLSEALTYAIANSRGYRDKKEDLYLAAINMLSEKHLWGPRFFDNFTADIEGVPESGDHTQTLELINELTVTQKLPYGGKVSAKAVIGYVEQIRKAAADDVKGGQFSSLVIEGDIPLLRNGGMSAREGLIQAERNLTYAVRSFERFRRTFMVNVATRYYDLLLQEAGIYNTEAQVASLERIAARTKALADSGRMPYIEVQRAQQQALFSRNNLLIAYERNALSFDSFKILIGMDPVEKLKIKPVEVVIPAPLLDQTAAIQTAHWYRLDLQTSADRIKDAERGVEVAKNKLLADFDITGNLTLKSEPDKVNEGVDFELRNSTYSAGAKIGLPLDRQIEQYDYRKSLIGLESSRRDYSLLKDQVTQDVRDAMRQIRQAKSSYDIQELNVELARSRQIGVQLRSRTLRVEELVNAQDDLLDAMNRRDLAMRDIRVSVLQYLLNTGQMRITGTGDWMPPAKLQPIQAPVVVPEEEPGQPKQLDMPEEQDS